MPQRHIIVTTLHKLRGLLWAAVGTAVLLVSFEIYLSTSSSPYAEELHNEAHTIDQQVFRNTSPKTYFDEVLSGRRNGWSKLARAFALTEELWQASTTSQSRETLEALALLGAEESSFQRLDRGELLSYVTATDNIYAQVAAGTHEEYISNRSLDVGAPILSEQSCLDEVGRMSTLTGILMGRIRARIALQDLDGAWREIGVMFSLLARYRPTRYGVVIVMSEVRTKVLELLVYYKSLHSGRAEADFLSGSEMDYGIGLMTTYLKTRLAYYRALVDATGWLDQPDTIVAILAPEDSVAKGIIPLLVDDDGESFDTAHLVGRAFSRNKMRSSAVKQMSRLRAVFLFVDTGRFANGDQFVGDDEWRKELQDLRSGIAGRVALRRLMQ